MGDLDTETWIEAARSYVRLRRLGWRCCLGMLALLIFLLAPIYLFENKLNSVMRGVLLTLFVIAWFACWLGGSVATFALWGFRCPRCGRRFIVPGWGPWSPNRCRHCDLNLDPATMGKAKTPTELDLCG